jgi:hypothetical protein
MHSSIPPRERATIPVPRSLTPSIDDELAAYLRASERVREALLEQAAALRALESRAA